MAYRQNDAALPFIKKAEEIALDPNLDFKQKLELAATYHPECLKVMKQGVNPYWDYFKRIMSKEIKVDPSSPTEKLHIVPKSSTVPEGSPRVSNLRLVIVKAGPHEHVVSDLLFKMVSPNDPDTLRELKGFGLIEGRRKKAVLLKQERESQSSPNVENVDQKGQQKIQAQQRKTFTDSQSSANIENVEQTGQQKIDAQQKEILKIAFANEVVKQAVLKAYRIGYQHGCKNKVDKSEIKSLVSDTRLLLSNTGLNPNLTESDFPNN